MSAEESIETLPDLEMDAVAEVIPFEEQEFDPLSFQPPTGYMVKPVTSEDVSFALENKDIYKVNHQPRGATEQKVSDFNVFQSFENAYKTAIPEIRTELNKQREELTITVRQTSMKSDRSTQLATNTNLEYVGQKLDYDEKLQQEQQIAFSTKAQQIKSRNENERNSHTQGPKGKTPWKTKGFMRNQKRILQITADEHINREELPDKVRHIFQENLGMERNIDFKQIIDTVYGEEAHLPIPENMSPNEKAYLMERFFETKAAEYYQNRTEPILRAHTDNAELNRHLIKAYQALSHETITNNERDDIITIISSEYITPNFETSSIITPPNLEGDRQSFGETQKLLHQQQQQAETDLAEMTKVVEKKESLDKTREIIQAAQTREQITEMMRQTYDYDEKRQTPQVLVMTKVLSEVYDIPIDKAFVEAIKKLYRERDPLTIELSASKDQATIEALMPEEVRKKIRKSREPVIEPIRLRRYAETMLQGQVTEGSTPLLDSLEPIRSKIPPELRNSRFLVDALVTRSCEKLREKEVPTGNYRAENKATWDKTTKADIDEIIHDAPGHAEFIMMTGDSTIQVSTGEYDEVSAHPITDNSKNPYTHSSRSTTEGHKYNLYEYLQKVHKQTSLNRSLSVIIIG